MATHKSAAKRADDGAANGGALDFDSFVDRLHVEQGAILAYVWVAESSGDGGRTFGARLGKVPLLPLDDLEERLRTEWPGPRVLVLRVKSLDGRIAHTGRLPLAGPTSPPAAPAATDALALMLQANRELQQRLDALQVELRAPRQPQQNVSEQVGALQGLAAVLKGLVGDRPAQQDGSNLEQAKAFMEIGKQLAGNGGSTSIALEALKMFGPAGVDVLKTSAALMMFKLDAAADRAATEKKKIGGDE